jgi:3-phosphoshikimate 1-carboxyvinyltransferase
MAMAFAPLGLLTPVEIEEPHVVRKSYPRYWENLADMGFILAAAGE